MQVLTIKKMRKVLSALTLYGYALKPKKVKLDQATAFADLDAILAFGFGSGLSKFAPGTAGTLVAIPLVWLLSFLPGWLYLASIVIGFWLGIGICDRVSNKLGQEDPSCIVWDEIIGFAITMSFAPHQFSVWILGFFLFRFFDVLKPWPIIAVERKYHGGLGIMLDDVLAGFFSFIILQIFIKYVL